MVPERLQQLALDLRGEDEQFRRRKRRPDIPARGSRVYVEEAIRKARIAV